MYCVNLAFNTYKNMILRKYISSIVIIVIVENQVYLFEMIDYMFNLIKIVKNWYFLF